MKISSLYPTKPASGLHRSVEQAQAGGDTQTRTQQPRETTAHGGRESAEGGWQTPVALIIVGLSIAWILWRRIARLRALGKGSGCGCGGAATCAPKGLKPWRNGK